MKKIVKKDGIRISNFFGGEPYYIGNMLLHSLVSFLASYRDFNKELVIKHLKENYEIDISESLTEKEWKVLCHIEGNIYESFVSENPRTGHKESSRDYFKRFGKNYYENFIIQQGHLLGKDFLFNLYKSSVIHHIFPLALGGDNSLENLVHTSDFNHKILHKNPFENKRKYCFQSMDYLYYLHNPWNTEKNEYLDSKYEISKQLTKSPSFVANYYKGIIEAEMEEFYDSFPNG